jgi:hypothetical protein
MSDTDTEEPVETLIELDERKRVVLSMARPGRYLARVEHDGTIVLRPAVVMSELEAAILRSPDIMRQLNEATAAGNRGTRHEMPRRTPAQAARENDTNPPS